MFVCVCVCVCVCHNGQLISEIPVPNGLKDVERGVCGGAGVKECDMGWCEVGWNRGGRLGTLKHSSIAGGLLLVLTLDLLEDNT